MITQHEEKLSNILLDFLKSKKKVRIIGKKISENKNRAPTISFTIENETSKKVCDHLVSDKIGIRNGNFYAWRIMDALKIDREDGVIRASMVHYNTENEVYSLINSLEKIL